MDGRINCPILAKKIANATGVKTLEQADVYVNDHLLDKSPVGGLAVLCAQAAEEGDLVAKTIIKECAAKILRLYGIHAVRWKESQIIVLNVSLMKPFLQIKRQKLCRQIYGCGEVSM